MRPRRFSATATSLLLAACWRTQDRAEHSVHHVVAEPEERVVVDRTTVPYFEAPEIVALALGDGTTCARFSDGQVKCRGHLTLEAGVLEGALEVSDVEVCGRGSAGQRCLREGVDRRVTTAFVEVARGAGARVGRDPKGGVWAFVGDAEEGVPLIEVRLPGPAAQIAADAQRSCARLEDGQLVCWDPYASMSRSPAVQVVATGVRGLDASYLRLCWHTDDGVSCWEQGGPRAIAGVERPTAVAVGRHHACALSGGVPVCWGGAALGQLGGTPRKGRSQAAVPVELPPGGAPLAIEAGDDHTCVLREGGKAWCWGRDDAGQSTGEWP
jgi:hypothetical protein